MLSNSTKNPIGKYTLLLLEATHAIKSRCDRISIKSINKSKKMDKLTDEQLKVLGTAIGAEIVRSFSAKQEYWYGSQGWVAELVKVLAEKFADKMTGNIRAYEDWFASLGKKILGKN